MAEVVPFRGTLYNVSKVPIGEVLAPPYDIITPEYQEALYNKSPYNIVRIDFGKELPDDSNSQNKYTRARNYLEEWLKEGILTRSERRIFYAYEMSFTIHKELKRLLGFLGLVRIEELGKGRIRPHECTYSKPKKDRLTLLRTCEANTSPIFSLYRSSDGKISGLLPAVREKRPYLEATDAAGALHRVWLIDQEREIETIKEEMRDKDIIIADGHHRYETALEYHREMNSQISNLIPKQVRDQISNLNPWDYVLMFLANIGDEGVTILPTHRLVKKIPEDIKMRLSQYFDIEPVRTDFDISERIAGRRNVFGFYQNNEEVWNILTLKGGDLSRIHPDLRGVDVIILHDLILKEILEVNEIGYEMDTKRTIDKVRNGEFAAAFFLNPTRVEDVEIAARSSVRMPPKSTYFYPKLLTGIVINPFFTFDKS